MAGRAEQLRLKQKEAEEQLKMQQAENELMRMACETNACLEAEHARLRAEAAKQYREDLKKQIEYSEELRVRNLRETVPTKCLAQLVIHLMLRLN